MIDGIAAANWLLNYGQVTPSRCLLYVWLAYKAQGASTSMGAPNAYIACGMSDGLRAGDRNPPAGAAVWWGRRTWDGNLDGDVVISLGGGRVAVTEAPGMGSVTGSCTLDEREEQISREYLGWTSSIFDCPINVAAGKDAAPSNVAAAASPEEDDMYAIRLAGSPDSGIIIRQGVPPYSLPSQVFETEASTYGLDIKDLPDWRYGTAVREHWTAFNTAQAFSKGMSQDDIAKIATCLLYTSPSPRDRG